MKKIKIKKILLIIVLWWLLATILIWGLLWARGNLQKISFLIAMMGIPLIYSVVLSLFIWDEDYLDAFVVMILGLLPTVFILIALISYFLGIFNFRIF